jgi:hypothetical protein
MARMGRPSSLSIATSYKDSVVGGYSSADVMQLARAAKTRAENKAVPFAGLEALYCHTIDTLIRTNGLCECCGKNFQRKQTGKGGGGKDSLSLHRVIASLGYVPSNVRIICQECNNAIGEIQNGQDLIHRFSALEWQKKIMGD